MKLGRIREFLNRINTYDIKISTWCCDIKSGWKLIDFLDLSESILIIWTIDWKSELHWSHISRLWTAEPVRKQSPNLHKWLLPAEYAKENNTSFSWGTGFWNMTRVGPENPPKGDFHYRRRKGKQRRAQVWGKVWEQSRERIKMGFESNRGTMSESHKRAITAKLDMTKVSIN